MDKREISNSFISSLFSEMATLLEFSNENPFRVRAYQKASQIIEGLTKDLKTMTQEEIMAISGIGKGISSHIEEILKTGTFSELENYRKKFPRGLLDIVKIQGIGAKRACILYNKLGIDSIEKLKEKAKKGEIRNLEGFGEKIEENILSGIEFQIDKKSNRLLYWNAKIISEKIMQKLREFGVANVTCAGSLRRGKETIGDIDILCTGRMDGTITSKFSKIEHVEKILSIGQTKASVLLKDKIQCDLRIVPEESFGAALMYFTGSKEHNVLLREFALKKGWTLNEYGLFKASDKAQKRPIASRTEEKIYETLGIQFIPPELREGRGELDLALKKSLPELVCKEDINGDIHNHTIWTDGVNSFEEMAQTGMSKGWTWLFLGDHSVSLGVTHGLDYKKYIETRKELLKIAKKFPGLKLGRSIEIDILKNGDMDFNEEEMKDTDIAIGAVHSSLHMKEEQMTERIIKAIRNPCVDVMAHLSGRLIGKREPSQINYDRIFEEALKHDVAFEINGQPDRQDLTDVYARKAKETGLKVVLTTDAHSAEQLDYMEMSLVVARRAGLTKKDILNFLSYEELVEWIKNRRRIKD